MKAISIDKPRSVGIIDVPEPKAGENEAIIKMKTGMFQIFSKTEGCRRRCEELQAPLRGTKQYEAKQNEAIS